MRLVTASLPTGQVAVHTDRRCDRGPPLWRSTVTDQGNTPSGLKNQVSSYLGASPDTAEEPTWCTPSTGHDACTMGDEPAVFVRESLPVRGALPRPANRTADGDRPGAAPGHLGQDRARRPAASPTIYRGMFMARVGIVTGAASGIGQALATALVNRGDTVVLADVNRRRSEAGCRRPGLPRVSRRSGYRDADAVTQLVDDVVGEIVAAVRPGHAGAASPR